MRKEMALVILPLVDILSCYATVAPDCCKAAMVLHCELQ